MRAVMCREWGDPSVLKLEDVAPPEAGPGEILLDVKAASVNFADIVMTEASIKPSPIFRSRRGSKPLGTSRL